MANFADDNTPYAVEKTIDPLLQNLVRDTSILTKLFGDNYFKMNPDKCHLLVCKRTKEISIILENVIIDSSDSVKLLGITIDKKLNFSDQVSKHCKKTLVQNYMHWQEFLSLCVKIN